LRLGALFFRHSDTGGNLKLLDVNFIAERVWFISHPARLTQRG
jgi:hypothetical protein